MNDCVRVGVFPSGSEVSAEVFRSLENARIIELVGLSSVPDYGDVLFSNNRRDIPHIHHSGFIEAIRQCVSIHRLDLLIPGMDEVGYLLKQAEPELGCQVVYAHLKTAEIIRRKSTTYRALSGIVSTPKMLLPDAIQDNDFPCFLKLDIGYGSRGARKIENRAQLEALTEGERETGILCEYLPGEELTVDCFSDPQSRLLFCGPRTRERIKTGISVSSRPVELTDEIHDIGLCISSELNMSGCWFFQLKKDRGGRYKLLEVASRLAGSMSMHRLLGVNLILLDIYQRLGFSVTVPARREGDFRLERAFDARLVGKVRFNSVYVDLDDCLLSPQGVNTRVIAFIFACLNRDLPVFLVTRHAGDLTATLTRSRLAGLFDEIYHLVEGQPKSSVIQHDNALFIDDSFAERLEVEQNSGAVVMSLDMLTEDFI
ncbi:ATP-grasp domain-containing protein [Marinobacter sp. R17]|uniref:ATP-grasp domain-containing protein n=1 Tax=Marinobacter sp. R17 TaxID=2484250 RepID=UPI000F4B55EB|nr:ATP-grasp domain-containing protein [Marinobacter sp. R17]